MGAFGLVLACLGFWAPGQAQSTNTIPAWRLVWSDEFEQANGSAPSSARWAYDTGGNGWGNSELQSYTSRRTNSFIQDGKLVIQALRENFTGSDGIARSYTSARLKTQGLAFWNRGRMEARMKIAGGRGLWPAFWMLGNNISSVGWPNCGEIDIMENIGSEPNLVHGSAHGPGFFGNRSYKRTYALPPGERFSDDFHVFSVEWEGNTFRWQVDNRTYSWLDPASMPAAGSWPFNGPMFLILNCAVGGIWPGSPDNTTPFPARTEIDYVRVYARTEATEPALQINPAGDSVEITWPTLFPHFRLKRASALGASWSEFPWDGRRRGTNFVAIAAPGLYQLQIAR